MNLLSTVGYDGGERPTGAAAAWIPREELAKRTHELGPPERTVVVATTTDLEALRPFRPAVLGDLGTAAADTIYRLWEPNPFLASLPISWRGKSVLDFGCGAGRDAVWLAHAGAIVTAVDHLPDARQRASDLAARYAPEARLTVGGEWPQTGADAEIVVVNFAPIRIALARLRPGQTLIAEAYHRTGRAKTGRPSSSELVWDESDLAGFDVQRMAKGEKNGQPTLAAWLVWDG